MRTDDLGPFSTVTSPATVVLMDLTVTTSSVGRVMHSPVVAVDEKTTLREAARLLRDADIGTLVVEDEGEEAIAGIVSERDVTRALADGADPDEVWVADVMSREPRYATAGDQVSTALDVMLVAGIRHLPVLEEGELVGIVSMRDLLGSGMHLALRDGDLAELRTLLDDALRDLSHDIADTDNAEFRDMLRTRRERLQRVKDALGR
ncbi:MAG: cyclic nucleotide-binding/CBS domain-containing protein [Acidimicrobiales bacterium]